MKESIVAYKILYCHILYISILNININIVICASKAFVHLKQCQH